MYKHSFHIILSLLILLSFCTEGFAQTKVKLSGKVIDEEQNPVIFAIVRATGQVAGTTTDLNGRYNLEFETADTILPFYLRKSQAERMKEINNNGNNK